MAKLTDKQKKRIIADYVQCQNYSEVGRKYKISHTAVKNITDGDKETFNKLQQKSIENTKEVLEEMKKRNKTKIDLIDKIFKAMDEKLENVDVFTSIKDLATAYGIILDKEIKIKEIEAKETNNKESSIQRVQIINDLPKDEEYETD